MTEFFYLLEKQFLINFSSPCLRRIKVSNFSSSWVQYCTRQETEDSKAVTLIQECLVSWLLYSSVHSEYSMIPFMHIFALTVFFLCTHKTTKE